MVTAQKMKFSIKDFSSKCDQISSKLRNWSRLLEKSFRENFIFCAVGFQKESPEVFYKKSCSLKFININWKTPVFESQVFLTATLLKRGSNIGFFPLNIAKFLRTPILQNTCERFLLVFPVIFSLFIRISLRMESFK